jgi:ABC-type polysaccharide/polyol phosphate export permease
MSLAYKILKIIEFLIAILVVIGIIFIFKNWIVSIYLFGACFVLGILYVFVVYLSLNGKIPYKLWRKK